MGVISEEPQKSEKEGGEKPGQGNSNPSGGGTVTGLKPKPAGVQKATAAKRGPGRPKKMLTTAQAIKRLAVKFDGEYEEEERNKKSKKRRKEKKFMEDDPILREEKEEGLQRSLRWLPVRGLRRVPSKKPPGVPQLVWESYEAMNNYMCEIGPGKQQQHTDTEREEEGGEGEKEEEAELDSQQPLKRPNEVPEPLWHAYHSFDDWMFRKCLTPDEVRMLPLERTVDKAWPGAPDGFKYIAEDVLVFDEPEKVEGTAFEYKLTDCHLQQLKSGRRVSMGRRPSQSPDIDLGTFLPHEDLVMNQIDSDLVGWI
ncbi:hypothetical protein PG990_006452 [Apiospora arundinis]|uniref:Uncharacterized protein n=1 Tax=Apiospora arundinis TaxID=335852 RepID=A0ABR2JA90_9PEZI